MANIDSKMNFVVPLDGDYTIFIPQPSKYEVMAISKVLGYFYEQVAKGASLDVLVVDWERIVDESLQDFSRANDVKQSVLSFLEKTMFSSFIKLPTAGVVAYADAKLTEERQEYFKGTILFIFALFRYASTEIRKTALKGYTTSLNSEAWKQSVLTSSTASEVPAPAVQALDSMPTEEQMTEVIQIPRGGE